MRINLLKRVIVITSLLLASSNLSAYIGQGWGMELSLGPNINVMETTSKINLGIAVGSDVLKFGLNLGYARATDQDLNPPALANMYSLKPTIIVEAPFYIENKEFNQTFAVGPVFDVGSTITLSGSGKTNISLVEFGAGLKVAYFFTQKWAIGFVPCHFTVHTWEWKRGLSTQWKFGVSYDSNFIFIFAL